VFRAPLTQSRGRQDDIKNVATNSLDNDRLRVICRVCGAVNQYTRRFCAACRSTLQGGHVLPEREAEALDLMRRKATARFRMRVRFLGVVAVLLILGFVGGCVAAAMRSPPALPTPSTTLTAASSSNQWSMDGWNPQNTGSMPANTELAGTLRRQFKSSSERIVGISVVNQTVYASSADGRIVSFDAQTGLPLWELSELGPLDSSPTIAGDVIFVAQRGGLLLATNRHTGGKLWSAQTHEFLYSPVTVVDGELFTGSAVDDPQVISYDAATGKERWRTRVEDSVVAPPSVSNGRVVVSNLATVSFFEIKTGRKVATYDPGPGAIVGPPVIVGDIVLVLMNYGAVISIDLHLRGESLLEKVRPIWTQAWVWGLVPEPPKPRGFKWLRRVSGGGAAIGMATSSSVIYVASDSGHLTALDFVADRELWRFQAEGPARGAPSLVGPVVYFASGRSVYALNASDGTELWRVSLNERVSTRVVSNGNALYVGGESGSTYIIE
jgi:outer membrane protein assembly factor BamB